jgi:hypothetical protein
MAVVGRSIRLAIWSGVAQPVWLATAARIAAPSSLVASIKAGSVRLAGDARRRSPWSVLARRGGAKKVGEQLGDALGLVVMDPV